MILAILLVLFSIFLISGTPIFIAIGMASVMAITFSGDLPQTITITRLVGGLDRFAVMALPFYIFAAGIMDVGGLSERIVGWAKSLVRGITGGMAVATEIACMAFGALSGSSPATVVAIGRIIVPRLEKEGYDKGFIAGLITSSGSIASIIPPSISMMLFAAATGVSTGALFIGGILPGILYGTMGALYCIWYAKRNKIKERNVINTNPSDIPDNFLVATRKAIWALGVPVIIIGGIYGGIVTPTEAAGFSAIYALFVGVFIYKKIGLHEFIAICEKSVTTIAQVMILISVASIFAWLLTIMQLAQKLTVMIGESASSYLFLMMVNIILLILGMFMDPNSLIIILGPIFYTVGLTFGLSPTHLGVIMTMNLAIGMFTPPFGLNLFVANTVIDVPMVIIYRRVIPFIIVSIITLLLVTYIPQVTLFLPSLIYGPNI